MQTKNSSSYGDSQNKNKNASRNSNSRSKMSDSKNCGRNSDAYDESDRY